MIFVTIGSAPHDFSRLIEKIDEIAPLLQEEFIVQLGFTKYRPLNVKWFDFVPYQEALNYFKSARLIIGHASAGPIMHAREFHKPVIIVPRNGDLGEHVDNHQIETAQAVEGLTEFIEVIFNIEDLLSVIKKTLNKNISPEKYEKSKSLDSLIQYIKEYIISLEK
ncbi:MAG: glycosyltransferase [Candidatus Omnitrophota bacterium]